VICADERRLKDKTERERERDNNCVLARGDHYINQFIIINNECERDRERERRRIPK